MPVHGVIHGVRHGVIHGISRVSFPRDLSSGKGVPLTQAEWNSVFSAAGVPVKTVAHSHGFQDTSGNVAATVGTLLTVTGTVDYQQTFAGFTRKGIGITETASERIGYATGVGPNPATGSVLIAGYVDVSTPAAIELFLAVSGGATAFTAQVTTAGLMRITCAGVSTSGVVDHAALGVVPAFLQYDKTASRAALYTESEKIVGTYNSGVVDAQKGWGVSGGGTPTPATVGWDSWFAGANAEWTEAQIKAVMQVLGWVPAWS